MKTEKNILIAFTLNLLFSVFELLGGIFTGSAAIISDSVHDMGDAVGIGISYLTEKKSKNTADEKFTYGYARFSVIGSAVSTLILLSGSIFAIYNAVCRIINPVSINYNGMIIFAAVGVAVNAAAAFYTNHVESLNQKAVNLHMLEDVLGWIVVFIGAIVIRYTDFIFIDILMSVCVAVFIIIHAVKHLKETVDILLEKVPDNINADEIKKNIEDIDGVLNVHSLHIWTLDGIDNYATLHISVKSDNSEIKQRIRDKLKTYGIHHITIETEIKKL